MFLISRLVIAALVAVSVASQECYETRFQIHKCCKSMPISKPIHENHGRRNRVSFLNENLLENLTACEQLRKPLPSCEAEICKAKLYEYADTEEGKFNKNKLTETLQVVLEPELAAKVIKHCVVGDLSRYGSSDHCDLIKYGHCHMLQGLAATCNWDSSVECQKEKELIEKCTS